MRHGDESLVLISHLKLFLKNIQNQINFHTLPFKFSFKLYIYNNNNNKHQLSQLFENVNFFFKNEYSIEQIFNISLYIYIF